jgi:hypothetical protein
MAKEKSASLRFGWYFPRVLALIVALFGVSFFFMYSDIMARAFQSVVKLETHPGFTGGRVAETLYDPLGDDHGFGGLQYPLHAEFSSGSLDLVRFVVHEPVYGAQWVVPAEYWQLDLSFAAGPETVRNIRIYIDADGDGAGSTRPRDDMAEGVAFDPSHPWDYALAVHGTEGTIESSDAILRIPLSVSVSNSGKDVSIRVPLSDRRLQGFYGVQKTSLYVCVGAWSPWGHDGFAPVGPRAGSGSGGGAVSALTPKLYDCLVPEGTTQEVELSSWDEDSLDLPVIEPVSVRMRAVSGNGGRRVNEKLVAEMESLAQEEAIADKRALEKKCESDRIALGTAGVEGAEPKELCVYGASLFFAGKRDESERMIDRVLAVNGEMPEALAYKGSLVAMHGRDASPLAAVDIIAGAYRYLDRAVESGVTDDEIFAVRYARGNTSLSVPESVFGKSLQGAEDFLAIADKYKKLSSVSPSGSGAYLSEIAEAELNAARCYENAGRDADAGFWFTESARCVGLAVKSGSAIPAWIRLEIARRGFLQ